MQNLRPPFAAGDAVIARGERWVVEETTAFEDCVLLQLAAPASGAGHGRRACLLHPFDRPVAATPERRTRVVTRTRWMNNLQFHLADLRGHGQLRSARSAAIDILPFQLEPALAVVRGRAARVLLADEVGLGKTIQAGLVLAELRQRGWCEHALVLSPAGLCRQWAEELGRRFGIATSVLDTNSLRGLSAALPFGVNPWSVERVVIASTDFIKQPEVLHAAASILWDILIVDEAHQAATAPQRAAAVNLVARRSRHLLLITATPHAGDEAAYRSLCAIGRIGGDDPLLLFRRTRNTVGFKGTRKVRLLAIRPGPEEREMHHLLARYVQRLWQIGDREDASSVRLVAMVLSKRALSSASSLASSIERRLGCLTDRVSEPVQTGLPIGASEDDDRADAEPGFGIPAFERIDEERASLRAILAAAYRVREETKVQALVRLLRRAAEPAVVFTEYRDTLALLASSLAPFRRLVLLHGGLSADERRIGVQAFNSGSADLLLATDAGSEGLNLQPRCRLVVNLELPWNPIRLEQRIGRVDRLGQSRTVHAVNLFAEGTAEATVLASLLKRLDKIRASEIDIAGCVIGGREPSFSPSMTADTAATIIDLQKESDREAERLRDLKRRPASPPWHGDYTRLPVCVLRSRDRRFSKSPEALWFYRTRIVNGCGRLVEDVLVPVRSPLSAADVAGCCWADVRRRSIRAIAERLLEQYQGAASAAARLHLERRASVIAGESREWIVRARTREQQLSQTLQTTSPLFQAGLFDGRTLRQREEGRAEHHRLMAETASRAGHLGLEGLTTAQEPELALLLLRC
ncbi:MAG: DEAD/DEAH box helicase [Vicinamibacterales bacterium]|nr:DEAD/DEAH box helicase [Vicinamibacterales bacterium]